MNKLTDRDLEKIYYGWLGKAIGIRYGAPVEMWNSEQICEKYSDVDGYFVDYNDFAADDDSNGPIFFFRAFGDCKDVKKFGFDDMAHCWKNYVPYEHGFYWWGGYGVSEEHTAYLNLQSGIMPPKSGSIEKNGKTLAEQIGGQIFIDVWGLVSPYDYHEAARLAEIAARVSHDGVAVDGGKFVAAMISAAFGAKNVREVIERASEVLPDTSGYLHTVKDIVSFYDSGKSAKECFDYIRKNYWKDKFGGNCHIIPNAAIIVYSLLYGEGDFIRTLKIANYSGFDTDCNVGNIGTVVGVLTEMRNVDYDKWIAPVRDTTLCSSLIGYSNIVNIPNFAYEIFRNALRLRGEEYFGKYSDCLKYGLDDVELDFAMPGSVSGMRSENASIKNIGGTLEVNSTDNAFVYYKTYYGKADLFDNRYDPAFSPKVYRGQTVYADYESDENTSVRIFYNDLHTGKIYYSESGASELVIDGPRDMLVSRIGIAVDGKNGGRVLLKRIACRGKVDYDIDFSNEIMEEYILEHQEVRQCTYYKGCWRLEDGELVGRCLQDGQLYTSKPLENFTLETVMTPVSGNNYGVIFGAKGAGEHYRLVYDNGMIRLIKYFYGETVLCEKPVNVKCNQKIIIKIVCKNGTISAWANGDEIYYDVHEKIKGIFGAFVGNGSVARFEKFTVRED